MLQTDEFHKIIKNWQLVIFEYSRVKRVESFALGCLAVAIHSIATAKHILAVSL